jgi:hypothetical protein
VTVCDIRRYTCDLCGRRDHEGESGPLPPYWAQVELTEADKRGMTWDVTGQFHVCDKCRPSVRTALKLKNEGTP